MKFNVREEDFSIVMRVVLPVLLINSPHPLLLPLLSVLRAHPLCPALAVYSLEELQDSKAL
jgi:hypothetical protein